MPLAAQKSQFWRVTLLEWSMKHGTAAHFLFLCFISLWLQTAQPCSIQTLGYITTDKLCDLINWTWFYHHCSGAATLLGFILHNCVFSLLIMTVNKNISSQWLSRGWKHLKNEQCETWKEVVTFPTHRWIQTSKIFRSACSQKRVLSAAK